MKKPKYTKDFGSTAKKEEKKRVSKEFVWTLFIALIMVSSIIGFMWVGEEEPVFTYKDKYKFVRRNNAFVYKQDDQEFVFRFLPYEVEELAKSVDSSRINKPMLYLTFNPDSELLQSIDLLRFELSNDLPKLNIYLSQGITNESDIYNLPVVDCENASSEVPVIKLAKANTTAIAEKDGCFLFVAKNDYDLAKLKDIMLYLLLGII